MLPDPIVADADDGGAAAAADAAAAAADDDVGADADDAAAAPDDAAAAPDDAAAAAADADADADADANDADMELPPPPPPPPPPRLPPIPPHVVAAKLARRAAARAALQPHLGAAMLAATAAGQAALAHSPEHAARATGRGSRDRVSRSVGVADPGAASLVVEAMQRSAARRGKEPARGRGAAAAPARVARTGAQVGANKAMPRQVLRHLILGQCHRHGD